MATCKACGNCFDEKSGDIVGDHDYAIYCIVCWRELVLGMIPNITGPSYAPKGTRQVWRQRVKRRHTDSG